MIHTTKEDRKGKFAIRYRKSGYWFTARFKTPLRAMQFKLYIRQNSNVDIVSRVLTIP